MVWAPDYLTLAEAKAHLRITDSVDDVDLAVWVTAASRAIDGFCNRQFGQIAAPAARTYRRPPVWEPVSGMFVQPIDDLMDATGLLVGGVAYASSGATLLPDNAPADGKPWTSLGFPDAPTLSYLGSPVKWTHTARWGWSVQPAGVGGACRLQLSRWNWRREAPAGTAGSPSEGSEVRLLARLDPDVKAILSTANLRRRRRVG